MKLILLLEITFQGQTTQLMELDNITYLKDLDLSRRDYTVKVRVLRLWKQPMNNDSQQCFSIEMIVVDEQGTTMQANVLRRWFPRFEHVLNESECYFIAKPTIGLNESKYKYVNNQNKIGIYCDTNVYPCNDFCGPTYGFSFTSFKDFIDQTLPENEPLDVIGFVADVKDLKKFKTTKGKDAKKLNVVIQDLEMHTIFLSLWDTYAE
ncbi:uncharacterized protein LOC143616827 [Bidens hawaiensis]|uniref:uncharacterized protein LOC143616827 n=1 Tax=Bidens hawaiensis TaxID=980011 RepID=UPI0040496ABC